VSHWSQNPGQGNVSEVEKFGDAQALRVSGTDGVEARLGDVADGEGAASWQSAASTAWQERIARVYPTLDAAAQVARSWHGAAVRYRDEVTSIQSQEAAAHHVIDTAHHTIAAYAHVPGEVLGNPTVQAKLEQCERDIAHGYATLFALSNQRAEVDAGFVRSLSARGALDERHDWSALQGLYGDAHSVADIRAARVALADQYAALGDRAIKSTASSDEIAELSKFLAASASDPGLAAEFWSRYTGAEATSMLGQGVGDQLATGDPNGDRDVSAAAAVDFAQGLRASLAAASLTWDKATAQRFADQVWAGPGDPPAVGQVTGARAEIGYLFDDAEGASMSKHFTVALADHIDAYERGVDEFGYPHDRFLAWDQDTIAAANGHTADMGALWAAEGRGDPGASTIRIEDPLSRVLDTLGLYPDAAWDWLSSTDDVLADGATSAGPDRVDFYSQRDWSVDGWNGFGSLWEGSMQADGGLVSAVGDADTWNNQCDVASRVVAGLDAGGHLGVGTISDGGAAHLGNAVAQLIPFIDYQELTAVGRPDKGSPQWVKRDAYVFVAANDTGFIPYLNENAFGDLVAAVVSNNNGFVPIRQAVTQVENQLILNANETAATVEGAGQEAWTTALKRYAMLEASFEGAVGGADILQARLDDANIRMQMKIATLPLSFLPSSGAGAAVDFVAGQGVGFGVDSLTDYLASNETMADGPLDLSQRAGAAGIRSMIERLDAMDDCNLKHSYPLLMHKDTWIGTFTSDQDHGFYSAVWKATDNV